MKNSVDHSHENVSNPTQGLRNSRLAMILAITLAFGACSTPAEKMQHQRNKVAKLEQTLNQQAKNYHEVARQQNIQIDLRDEGADGSINQEIGYATEWANEYDKKIEKTKKKLAKAQRKLDEMEEEYGISSGGASSTEYGKLNKTKYDYIPEEYKRASK